MWSSTAKGKGRAIPLNTLKRPRNLAPRDSEGSGGPDGIVLPLQYVSEGPYDISYTLPILLGSDPSNLQNLSIQIDTGSSDLWIASSPCSSSDCSSTPLYDPTAAAPTNLNFNITYLVGDVSGPIVWDTVTVGGYSVSNQALAAANVVDSEPLESQFSGVLGLALPSNSIIASEITPIVGDTPDGAVWMSNLFSITPTSLAPVARFISIALERPGSPTVPSILGIGRHPAALVPDPSKVEYDILYAPSSDGPRFWKAAVRGITVYTNDTRMPIKLGPGVSGVFPSAVLDTGVPLILTTKAVADAIYGAIGISPAADNMYYMPCTTPLNMTVTLDDRDEIALHPLDLSTTPPPGAPDPNSCIGLIQTTAQATLENPTSGIGDMVFGVPFLRNVYTVLAFDIPNADGMFPTGGADNSTSTLAPTHDDVDDPTIHPRLGLLGLTNPAVAMDEFHRVRVLNQPLGDADGGTPSGSSGSHKQGVGIDVLIGLASFVGLCVLLFGLRWLVVRRNLRRGADNRRGLSARDVKSGRDLPFALGGYQLARRGSRTGDDDGRPTEDELRQRRYEAYMHSMHTVSTDRTQIEPSGDEGGYIVKDGLFNEPIHAIHQEALPISPRDHSPLLREESESPERARHRTTLSVNRPLLPDLEAGGGVEEPMSLSMVGVGTARHSTAFARGRSLSGNDPSSHRPSGSLSRSPDS
ncbi:aspartic peptidase domain-containing protein [Mycena alexandri]|uniref:Aspartic peptidase domain-containing protein n=1 Tax=Mycena alexandri TaxID=1745969 RepID=A0AAD6SQ48_9AGAR|nr:aspartic peptidase domain-containing protein [Mycena alexandri]